VLLNGLKPAIRMGVLRENKVISSRAQVLSAAQRQEELLGEAEKTTDTGDRPGKRARSETDAETPGKCYKCGKEGHFKRTCPDNKKTG
jgi:hypothetical protein